MIGACGGSPPILVVNADDFGQRASQNAGIATAHERGIVTSVSLMACGLALANALFRLRGMPRLGCGIHLTWTGERPLCPPGEIPTLVGADGRMPSNHGPFIRRFLCGNIRLRDAEREAAAQVEALLAAGLAPDHVNGHQHLHLLPGLFPATLRLAQRHGILVVRIPEDSVGPARDRSPAGRALRALCRVRRRAVVVAGLQAPSHFAGYARSGHLAETDILAVLSDLPSGVTEMMCHPGQGNAALEREFASGYDWEGEMAALTSPAVRTAAKNARLATFKEAMG